MENKTVLITGGSNGLGLELVIKLLKSGHFVINFDKEKISKVFLLKKVKDISKYLYANVDVTHQNRISEVKERLKDINKKPDILINNASINRIDYIEKMFHKDFYDVINVNVYGYFIMAKAFLPELKENNGTILNICSRASKQPMTASLPYNTSKAAQLMMSKQMAREFARENYGITVFAVSPGKIKGTKMSKYVDKRVPEVRGWSENKAKEYWNKKSVMPEEIDPKVLAEQIVNLLDSNHKHLNGCNLEMGIE